MSRTSSPRDPYEVLGVERDASEQQIKKAFRALAMELHRMSMRTIPRPRRSSRGPLRPTRSSQIRSDAPHMTVTGHEGLRSGGYAPNFDAFGSIGDLFDAFFGGGSSFGGRSGPAAGGDLAVAVEIDLVEAAQARKCRCNTRQSSAASIGRGNGAEPGTPIETCERCGGNGQLQALTRTPFGADGTHDRLRRLPRRWSCAQAAMP